MNKLQYEPTQDECKEAFAKLQSIMKKKPIFHAVLEGEKTVEVDPMPLMGEFLKKSRYRKQLAEARDQYDHRADYLPYTGIVKAQ